MSKQDYFTRDTHKPIEHKKVGSEVRQSLASKFTKALDSAKKPTKKFYKNSKGENVRTNDSMDEDKKRYMKNFNNANK